MKNKTLSLLEELESMHRVRDSKHIIESRASNVIASAINLLELIEETYSVDEATDLSRKLLNSIKHKDEFKFKRAVVRVNESAKRKRKLDES